MDLTDFKEVLKFIAAGIGKSLPTESVGVYYACLQDLPLQALQAAAIVVVNEHVWHTFPTVAEIRRAATTLAKGQLSEMSAAEAWTLAWNAVGRLDLDLKGEYAKVENGKIVTYPSQAEAILSQLPPLVAETMRAYGLPSLVYGTDEVSVVMVRFLKLYEQLAARNQRHDLMPAPVRQQIEVMKTIAQIGVEK